MKIVIQEYQNNWPLDFLKLRNQISIALKNFQVVIEHIGSTSVPSLGAKPIIDILAGLQHEADLAEIISPMQQLGFTYFRKYDQDWPERRLFVKLTGPSKEKIPDIIDIGDDDSFRHRFVITSNIHIVVKDGSDWLRHIAFRDYLRTHRAVRDEYYHLKKKLAERDFKDIQQYNDCKNDFVKQIEKAAIDWSAKKA